MLNLKVNGHEVEIVMGKRSLEIVILFLEFSKMIFFLLFQFERGVNVRRKIFKKKRKRKS